MVQHTGPLERPVQLVMMFLALVALAATALACGPTQSTVRINEAEVALEKAVLNEAENLAPYEYFKAKEYLYKAKEEWGYSDFEAALDYADRSKEYAEKATVKSKGTPMDAKPIKATPGKLPAGVRKPTVSDDPEADELEGLQ